MWGKKIELRTDLELGYKCEKEQEKAERSCWGRLRVTAGPGSGLSGDVLKFTAPISSILALPQPPAISSRMPSRKFHSCKRSRGVRGGVVTMGGIIGRRLENSTKRNNQDGSPESMPNRHRREEEGDLVNDSHVLRVLEGLLGSIYDTLPPDG